MWLLEEEIENHFNLIAKSLRNCLWIIINVKRKILMNEKKD